MRRGRGSQTARDSGRGGAGELNPFAHMEDIARYLLAEQPGFCAAVSSAAEFQRSMFGIKPPASPTIAISNGNVGRPRIMITELLTLSEQSTVCRRRPDADRRDSHGFARRDGFLGHIPNGLRTWFGVARWNWVARGLRGPHGSRISIVPSHRVWHARLTRAAVSGVAVTRGFVCLSLRNVVLMDNSKCARTKK